MRLYIFPFAPNVMRVQILISEKGIKIDTVDVSQDREGYRQINPMGQVPALELDDGRIVTESLTVCQYLDAVSGSPSLFGDDEAQRLEIAMWERRAEAALFNPSIEYCHHVHPMFAAWMSQFPDYAATLLPKAERALAVFADQLDNSRFIAGNRFTAADITAFLGYFGFVAYGGVKPSERTGLRRWSAEVLERDSFAAVREMASGFGIAIEAAA